MVNVPLAGVPRAGVTKVGEVAKTAAPLPVSSDKTPLSCALVVAANCDNGFDVSASPPAGVSHAGALVPPVLVNTCPSDPLASKTVVLAED